MRFTISILIFIFALNSFAQTNSIDSLSNLALSEDAIIKGSVIDGRGKISDILYNPITKEFATDSKFAEYGVAFGKKDSLVLSFQWETPKLINYITFGGAYPNQPQSQSTYDINILSKGQWINIAKGVGGWLNNGFYAWQVDKPILADAVVISLYGKSIHLRGLKGDEISTLIQLLPYDKDDEEETVVVEPTPNIAEEIIKANSLLLEQLVKMKAEINVLNKKIEVLKERINNLHSNE